MSCSKEVSSFKMVVLYNYLCSYTMIRGVFYVHRVPQYFGKGILLITGFLHATITTETGLLHGAELGHI